MAGLILVPSISVVAYMKLSAPRYDHLKTWNKNVGANPCSYASAWLHYINLLHRKYRFPV